MVNYTIKKIITEKDNELAALKAELSAANIDMVNMVGEITDLKVVNEKLNYGLSRGIDAKMKSIQEARDNLLDEIKRGSIKVTTKTPQEILGIGDIVVPYALWKKLRSSAAKKEGET